MKVKYPRTYHLPFSLGKTSDDKTLSNTDHFVGMEVVVTEKYDGENSSLYCDGYHARSIDGRHHVSRDWMKRFHGGIAHDIPVGWRICGENMYAQHSIVYSDLPSYFIGYSVWDDRNICLSWDDTVEMIDLLGIVPAKVLYRGEFDEGVLMELVKSLDLSKQEGYVVRNAGVFAYGSFSKNVAKWVRANHVVTDEHWMHSEVKPNGLKIV